MTEIIIAVISFTLMVVLLALAVLGARRILVPSGEVEIKVNDSLTLKGEIGEWLLDSLTRSGIQLPTACGGAGTCGLCIARVTSGGGDPLPQERALLSRSAIAAAQRLACQVRVLGPMQVTVDDAYFAVETWQCTVLRTHHVGSFIKEIVLALPDDHEFRFQAGNFIQITCPACQTSFKDFEVQSPYQDVWSNQALRSLHVSTDHEVVRAYSMANRPDDVDVVRLNVRIALPPPGVPQASPGIVSSWLFSLKIGDAVSIVGPFGHFNVRAGGSELVFIGGGVGMAPLHAQILDLLLAQNSGRRISFWYGARSLRELFYADEFEQLAKQFDNFSWHVVLSEPTESDGWQGHRGFVHQVAYEQYLNSHPAPEECEYFICGPPLMVNAVLSMVDELGVEPDHIHFDDFGG